MLYQILALLIWGSSFIAAKYSYEMLDPTLMVEARLLIAALMVLPSCRRHLGRIPRSEWKPLLWISFVNYVVVLMLQFIGLKYTSAASAITMVGLEPLLVVFVGHFFFNDKAKLYHWICGAVAFAGVGMMVMGGAEEGGTIDWFGCLLILLAGLGFAGVIRPSQQMIARIGAPAFTAASMAVAAVLCLPFSLVLADSYQINWSWGGTLSILYMGIGCSWLAYLLWNKGMNTVPANVSGLLISLEPVIGVIMAVLILGEHLSTMSAMGITVVIVSTFVAGMLAHVSNKHKNAV